MQVVLLIAVLAAGPAPASDSSAPVSLAAPGLVSANLSADVATFCSEHLAHQLSELGFRVVTSAEMGALIGVERQRALISCSENQSGWFVKAARRAAPCPLPSSGSVRRRGVSVELSAVHPGRRALLFPQPVQRGSVSSKAPGQPCGPPSSSDSSCCNSYCMAGGFCS